MTPSTARARAPGRPAGADGAQTRQRIMLVAMAHVAERGYTAATLKEIAREAGLTSGSIYHYFPSKVELVEATFHQVVGDVFPAMESAASHAPDMREMLTVLLEAALDAVQTYPHLAAFSAAVGVAGGDHPQLARLHESAMATQRRMVDSLVVRAQESAILPGAVDAQAASDVVFALLRGLTELSATVSPDRHRAAVRCTELLLRDGLFSPDR